MSIIINNLIFFTSFVFANISLTIGLQLDSGVGYFLILTTIAYLIMIATTVLTFQVIVDGKVWEAVTGIDAYEEGGRLYHSVTPIASLITDILPETSKFSVFDGLPIENLEGNNNSKKYTIMAICKVNHTYAEQYEYTYPGHELIFYLSSKEYLTYAESAKEGENQPMRYLFNTIDSQNIDDELQGLSFESRRKWTEDYLKELDGILGGTFLFAVGCAVIGFFVFVNTMIMSYLDRKIEKKIDDYNYVYKTDTVKSETEKYLGTVIDFKG